MAGNIIQSSLENSTLIFLLVGMGMASAHLLLTQKELSQHMVVKTFFSYFLFWSFGISYLYDFIALSLFPESSAHILGWQSGSFQIEVAFASLGFGIIGILASRLSLIFRIAATIGPVCFLWGAAGAHIHHMIITGQHIPTAANIILATDIILPVIALTLLWLQYRLEK